MQKPKNYDQTAAYGDFEALELGGHLCVIKKVEETTSKSSGRPMIKIYLDTAPDDIQPGFYADRYKSDNRPEEQKRWGCVVNQLTEDNNGFCSRGLKTFINAVEESNPNFSVMWDDRFCECLKNKRVGGVFRREQYEDRRDGSYKWSTKCSAFRSIEEIRNGVDVPEDKYLDKGGRANSYTRTTFEDLSDSDGELPFN